jgi:hypothetical protein
MKMPEPMCCKEPMMDVCTCVGFTVFWCSVCGRVVDRFDCCGHIHEIRTEDLKEAAPAICDGCGLNRIMAYERMPNGKGEGEKRVCELGMLRREVRRNSERKKHDGRIKKNKL